jgi:polysaccharide biosynthesis protein PslF
VSDLQIIQVSAEYPPAPGGVGDFTRLLSRALQAQGHHVAVLTAQLSAGDDPGDPRRLVLPFSTWSWSMLAPLARAITARQPDIVHIQYQTGAYGMHPAINLLPWLLRRFPQPPRLVVTMHDLRVPYLLPKAGALRRWVTRRLLVDVDAVIVTNVADRDRLAGPASAEPDLFHTHRPIPATVIPIGSNVVPQPPAGYDRAAWRAALGVGDGETLLVFFGLASPSKGLLPLVEALGDLPASIRLLVAGGEATQPVDQQYAAQVRATVARLGLNNRVHITGYCPAEEISAHLLAADIGVLPFQDGASYRRGSLLALLAHGVPLITTRPAEPLEPALRDGEQALLVEAASPPELRAAILRLVEQPALRRHLSRQGQALHGNFTWPAIAAAHETLYHALLAR